MKTVKLSDVVSFVRVPEVGDVCVHRTGRKVFVATQADIDELTQKKGRASAFFILRPTAISVDLLLTLLPGIFAYVPKVGRVVPFLDNNVFKNLVIPDLSAEADFKKTIECDKAKIDEAGAALAEAQVNYDKAVESFVSYVKANIAKVNK